MTGIAPPARRALWVVAGACAAVVIAAVILVLARPEPRPQPAGTPQAAVQSYTTAYLAGDWDRVRELSAQPGDAPCPGQPSGQLGLELVTATAGANSARVTVRVTDTTLPGPFAVTRGGYEDVFELGRVDGQWKIRTAPWQLALCSDEEMGYTG